MIGSETLFCSEDVPASGEAIGCLLADSSQIQGICCPGRLRCPSSSSNPPFIQYSLTRRAWVLSLSRFAYSTRRGSRHSVGCDWHGFIRFLVHDRQEGPIFWGDTRGGRQEPRLRPHSAFPNASTLAIPSTWHYRTEHLRRWHMPGPTTPGSRAFTPAPEHIRELIHFAMKASERTCTDDCTRP